MTHPRPLFSILLTLLFISGLVTACYTSPATGELPTVTRPVPTLQPAGSSTASPGVPVEPAPSAQTSSLEASPTETGTSVPRDSITVLDLPTPGQPLDGGTIQDGPFRFDLRLFRDPVFGTKPVAPSLYSDLEGIGVYSVWEYHGPDLAGPVNVYWGIEPDVSALLSQAPYVQEGVNDGDSDGRSGGLILPAGSQVGDVVRVILKIETMQKTYGAVMNFTLTEGTQGLKPTNVSVQSLEAIQ